MHCKLIESSMKQKHEKKEENKYLWFDEIAKKIG